MPAPLDIFDGKSLAEIFEIVRNELKKGQKVFLHTGRFVAWSGPDTKLKNFKVGLPSPPPITNGKRAEKIIDEWPQTVWLEGSPMGQFLFVDNDLYAGIRKAVGADKNKTKKPLANDAIDEIMAEISYAYIKAGFGHCQTAVCGAGIKRMFRKAELEALVKHRRVKTIAKLPRKLVMEFSRINADEAFQIVFSMEFFRAELRARTHKSPDSDRDLEQRLYAIKKERENHRATSKLLSPVWERKRDERRRVIFRKYKLEPLYDRLKALNLPLTSSPQKRPAKRPKVAVGVLAH
jgi:hypothetical protein